MQRSYEVRGMTCNGCVKSLTRAIGNAAPGLGFQVSLENGGMVQVDGEHDETTIEKAVADAGFQYGGRRAAS